MARTRAFGAATLVALVSVCLAFITNAVGRARIDRASLLQLSTSSALNNNHCVVNRVANACEDIAIHYSSNTAFLACGDPIERTHWYPPSGPHNAAARSEASFREFLFSYDILKEETTQLSIEGLDGDFVTHGLDLFQDPTNESMIYIFAVRHARQGDAISIFSHKLGSATIRLVKDVQHANIKTPNAVVAVGERQFYITNDHYFVGGPLRYVENNLGPWNWATDVQYCDASQPDVKCSKVAGMLPGANGLAVLGDRMFVGDSRNGTVTIYRLRSGRTATFEKRIELGAAADNIKIEPTTGDLIVAVFPTLEDLPLYLRNIRGLGKDLLVPSAAVRLSKQNDYRPELIFFDDGSTLSFMTAMALDTGNDIGIGTAVLQYGGFAVCKIPGRASGRFYQGI